MTTGRINQVTIFGGRRQPPRGGRGHPCPREGAGVVAWEGCALRRRRHTPGLRRAAGANPRRAVGGHPIATTVFPKAGVRQRDGERSPGFGIPASRGGYPLPVTSSDGYRCAGAPPSASRIVIASGQPSTDSFGAGPLGSQSAGLRVPHTPPTAGSRQRRRPPCRRRRGSGLCRLPA